MEGNNNAPFYIGQKVIALHTVGSEIGSYIYKGVEYTVHGLKHVCCGWHVDIGISSPYIYNGMEVVFLCDCDKTEEPGDGISWVSSKLLAPIDKRDHSMAVDKEIWDSLPKETEERSDVVVKPQEASVQNQLLDSIDEMIALLPKIPLEQRFAYADKIVEAINRTCKLIRGE